ncbi:cobalt-precorrin-5B (C(1))-methyltransferase CbiD [Synechococcus sp. M16CYN]|uniref:cobalt-precorrin-5B (C(1))-methyltransferase CbiD n=1 Tax=Synechococcus sp. M16CYN TaxID=3103139 RepID=UPI0032518854
MSSGLTLPVWVAAAAKASLRALLGQPFAAQVQVELSDRPDPVSVPVISAAQLDNGKQALAISYCDPGLILDLTRNLEIWVRVSWGPDNQTGLQLLAGTGVGTKGPGGDLCISTYARDLLVRNLLPLDRALTVEIVLPRGRDLALRTSNAAFGVVDGLALIGTQAEVQHSAAPNQLKQVLLELARLKADQQFQKDLVLVIGENGLDLARQAQLKPLLKVGNWLGPVMVAAAEAGVQNLLLLGYHGKLIKLAGGIFHTHHHLADGRMEVLTALGFDAGLSLFHLRLLRQAASVNDALKRLEALDSVAANHLWLRLASTVEQRSQEYVARYGDWPMQIGAVLFDRSRRLRWRGPIAEERFFTLMD